jgi:opacity protein-like surface antigen
MKRPAVWLFLALMTAGTASAQYYFDYPTFKRWEIGVFGGAAFPLFKATTGYEDRWNDRLLTYVSESSNISMKAKVGIQFGFHLSYFFNPAIGIRLEVGPQRSDAPTTTEFTFAWTWADGRHFQRQPVWNGTGRTTSLPASLDLVWRKEWGRNEWFIAGGFSFHRDTFRSEASFGYGISQMSADLSEQYLDALRVGLRIPEMSWTSFGFDLGLGLSIKLSDLVGIQIETRYFFYPSKRAEWQFIKGDYDGVFYGNIKGIDFNDGDIQLLTAGVNPKLPTSLRLDRSFFRLGVGLVLFLGSAAY